MKTAILAVLLLGSIALASAAGRELLAPAWKTEDCECGPYAEPRTPDEVCASTRRNGAFCNVGGYFPAPGCKAYYTCNQDGTAAVVPCPEGTLWDVQTNTCNYEKVEMDGKTVYATPCLGMMWKPLANGCYNNPNLNSGTNAWGLYNTGENTYGCGNTGTASVGVGNTGTFTAGCKNTGTASWGTSNSGAGTWGTGETGENVIG
jgi:hypothetical protein